MRLWFWPLLIGLLTTAGLITGRVSDDGGDYFAWIGLGLPVVLALWFGLPTVCASRSKAASIASENTR